MTRRSIGIGIVLCSALAILPPHLAGAGEPSWDARAVFGEFGFDASAWRAVQRGEIAVIDGERTMENELTSIAAMRLPDDLSTIATWLRAGLVILADRKISGYAMIDPANGRNDFGSATFDNDEKAEVERLIDAEPGTTFNLSTSEIAMLRDLARREDPQSAKIVAIASRTYRDILFGRYRSYSSKGLNGLADYARSDGPSSPSDDLHRIDTAPHLPRPLRKFARVLDAYPDLPAGVDSRFFWKKTIVDGRPIFVLSHVLVEQRPEAVMFALREYYVGHSYNVLQQLGVVLPMGDQSLLLAYNSTLTDRILGPFSAIAHLVGQSQSNDALRDYFVTIREVSSRPPP